MWVRGLKLLYTRRLQFRLLVAPYVGAWIETSMPTDSLLQLLRRTLCGCVD